MSHALTWCRRKAEVASGGHSLYVYRMKMAIRVIFAANDLKREKKR